MFALIICVLAGIVTFAASQTYVSPKLREAVGPKVVGIDSRHIGTAVSAAIGVGGALLVNMAVGK